MGPFDFLSQIGNGLSQYFAPTMTQASNTLEQFFPSKSNNFNMNSSPKAPQLKIPVPQQDYMGGNQQQQQPQQPSIPSPSDFQSGFSKFGQNVPLATQSAQLSQGAAQMPGNIDPYLAAVISLMETGGGAKVAGANNAWNLRGEQNGQTQFVNYPDFATALLGGDNNGVQSKGFMGTVLNDPRYANFRSSGNIGDFFKVYTPPGEAYGNPSLDELVSRYGAIRALFPQLLAGR